MNAREEDKPANSVGRLGHAEPVTVMRSEEQARIQLTSVPIERVRLERYVVSEERVITVVVRREEVRLIREPILPDEQSQALPVASSTVGTDHTVVLREEQVTITKTVVPVERVTLVKRSVIVNEDVTFERRKEQVTVAQEEISTGG